MFDLREDLRNVKRMGISTLEELRVLSNRLYDSNSTKVKTKILKGYIDFNPSSIYGHLQSFWRLIFNDFYRYGLTADYVLNACYELDEDFDIYNIEGVKTTDKFELLIDTLNQYLDKLITKTEAVNTMANILVYNSSAAEAEAFISIIKRDWEVGMTSTSFNKLFKEPFIPVFSVTKALEINIEDLDSLGTDEDRYFIETKYDGTRDFTVVPYECKSKEDIYTLSSNGRVLYIPTLQEDLFNYLIKTNFEHTGFVIDGELTVKDSILSSDRGTITGWHNSAIKLADGMNSKLADNWSEKVSFNAFDIVELSEFENNIQTDITLFDRKLKLRQVIDEIASGVGYTQCIKLAEYQFCTQAELKETTEKAYIDILSKGGEGLIIKDVLCSYSFDRNNSYWYKIKPNSTADLRVVGYKLSEDPLLPGGLGALVCETEYGTLKVEVGSGLSINDRGFYRVDNADGTFEYKPIPNYNIGNWLNKIVEVKYFGVTHTKHRDNHSLFLPRFKTASERKGYNTNYMSGELCAGIVRYDKKVANLSSDLVGYRKRPEDM